MMRILGYCLQETLRHLPKIGANAASGWESQIHPLMQLVPVALAMRERSLVFPKAKDRGRAGNSMNCVCVGSGLCMFGECRKFSFRSFPPRKQFIDTIKLIAYRAESALVHIVREKLTRHEDARSGVRGLFGTTINLRPDVQRNELRIELHGQSNPAHDSVIEHLIAELNSTETHYPGTTLRLKFATLRSSAFPGGHAGRARTAERLGQDRQNARRNVFPSSPHPPQIKLEGFQEFVVGEVGEHLGAFGVGGEEALG